MASCFTHTHTQTSSPHAECAPAVPLTEYQHLSSSAYNVLYHFAIVHEVEYCLYGVL